MPQEARERLLLVKVSTKLVMVFKLPISGQEARGKSSKQGRVAGEAEKEDG